MNKKKFQRLTALVLCLICALSCFSVNTLAADGAASNSGTGTGGSGSGSSSVYDTSEMLELLDLISYDKYQQEHQGAEKNPDKIVVDVIKDLYVGKTDANYVIPEGEKLTVDDIKHFNDINDSSLDIVKNNGVCGVTAIITPGIGDVSWVIPADKIPENGGLYTISIKYFALDDGMSNSVERAFQINGKVPFSEARYMTIKKNWVSNHEAAKYTGNDEAGVKRDAEALGIGYHYDENKILRIEYPKVWTSKVTDFCNKYSIRFFKIDIHGNELRPSADQVPVWDVHTFSDSTGFYPEAFEFYLEGGKDNIITFEGKNATLAISEIVLKPADYVPDYDTYLSELKDTSKGSGKVKIEGEYIEAASDNTIYALEDAADALTSPHNASKTLLNMMGGEKWQTAGQWVTYSFRVDKTGMYDIVTRFRQNILDGMFVNRALYLYTYDSETGASISKDEYVSKYGNADGYYNGAPFREAKKLTYNYSDAWQVTQATDGETEFSFYFNEGVTYKIKFEVTLGDMGAVINTVQTSLNSINNDYLSIIQLTGATPDTYRDYGFSRIMPDVLIDMVEQGIALDNDDPKKGPDGVAQQLTALAGQKSSSVGTLQKVSQLLNEMGTKSETIASSLDRLKSYIGTLGTFLSSAKTQPLEIDYILIQPAGEKEPAAQANIIFTFFHEVSRFFWSFFRDYDSVGAMKETTSESLEVWLATGRDQAQVKRNLVNNIFSQQTGITVELKLVAAGTLLPSILANKGPDVYHGLGQADVINYAIRSAVLPVEDFEGRTFEYKEDDVTKTYETESFWEAKDSFNDSAMIVLMMEDADGVEHYYGLPEAQGFAMMFVRVDVLAELGINVPRTWDDIMAAVPKLQARNMEIGITTDANIHLYQNGGTLFADEGMRINLDSKVGLTSFTKMCEFFTKYGFPYQYDAANRFRTGEMPILIGDYTGLYNQLKVFATEIEGLWTMVPVPGTVVTDEDGNTLYDDNGNPIVNNCAISSVNASVMVKGVSNDKKLDAWTYIEWFTDDVCQEKYGNEMVAIMGPSAKYNTANKEALKKLPWTPEERTMIQAQFDNLASVPNYPGAYIIARYTNFAFLSAYNEGADPTQALLGHIYTINKEITRKRAEFGLETLEQGETLANKRLKQTIAAAEEILARGGSYTVDGEDLTADALANKIIAAAKSEDIVSLNELSKTLYKYLTDNLTDEDLNGKKDDKGNFVKNKDGEIEKIGILNDTSIRINKTPDVTDKQLFDKYELIYYVSVALADAADAIESYKTTISY